MVCSARKEGDRLVGMGDAGYLGSFEDFAEVGVTHGSFCCNSCIGVVPQHPLSHTICTFSRSRPRVSKVSPFTTFWIGFDGQFGKLDL